MCFNSQTSLIEHPPRSMENPGRSGAKFFVSFDRKLLIKSITSEEVALLHQILQPYHAVSGACPLLHNLGILLVTCD